MVAAYFIYWFIMIITTITTSKVVLREHLKFKNFHTQLTVIVRQQVHM